MNYNYKIFIILLFLFFTEEGFAQARFKATAMLGVNLSQIDGDRQEGYRKRGISLGLDGSIYLRPDFDISTQLLYNAKGAKPDLDDIGRPNMVHSDFSLRYSEIAVLLNYHYNPSSSKTYYTNSLFAGLSYGRLLKSTTSMILNNQRESNLETNISSQFNPHDFSFIVGWSQLFTPRIGVSFRFTRTINTLYENPNYRFLTGGSGLTFEKMKPYFLSFHIFYNLVSPNKIMGLRVKKKTGRNSPLEELY